VLLDHDEHPTPIIMIAPVAQSVSMRGGKRANQWKSD
jgi:hypothetical protein